jgi:hypothetical protein
MSFRKYLVDQYHTNQCDYLCSLKRDRQYQHVEIDLSDIREINSQTRAQVNSEGGLKLD